MAMNDEYEKAFMSDEPMQEASEDVTEDMVEEAADEPAGLNPEPAEPAMDAAEPVADAADDGAEDEPIDEKELQRKRSWEGRLRAREAELKQKEDAMKGSHPAEKQDANAEAPTAEKAEEAMEQAVDQLESGDSAEAVMKQLAEDFGDDFASKLSSLIRHEAKRIAQEEAKSTVGQVSKTVEDMMTNIRDEKTRAHFEAIADRHPDFLDVAGGDAMQAYLDSLDEQAKTQAQKVVDAGSAREVIKLLDAVKAYKPQATEPDVVDEVMADAAEGVRSRGLSLPEKPKGNSYEDAWNEF